MTQTVEWEYLGSESEPGPRRRRAAVIVSVVLLVALCAVGFLWWSDHERAASTQALNDAYAAATSRAGSGERQVQSTLAYASPMIWSSRVGEDVRAGLRALVQDSAADVASDLDVLRESVASTRILPWHGEQAQARDAVLALLDDQVARFRGIAADARDIDLVLAGGPLPTGAARAALLRAGAG